MRNRLVPKAAMSADSYLRCISWPVTRLYPFVTRLRPRHEEDAVAATTRLLPSLPKV